MDEDKFKASFKYYKSKKPPPEMDKVIDMEKSPLASALEPIDPVVPPPPSSTPYLKDTKTWRVYKMSNGLHLISNPFTLEGISYWTMRCLKDFSACKNNLKLTDASWWNQVQNNPRLRDKLRWATLGNG